jgi:hypothetical protein
MHPQLIFALVVGDENDVLPVRRNRKGNGIGRRCRVHLDESFLYLNKNSGIRLQLQHQEQEEQREDGCPHGSHDYTCPADPSPGRQFRVAFNG